MLTVEKRNGIVFLKVENNWKKNQIQALQEALKETDKRYLVDFSISEFKVPSWSIFSFFGRSEPTRITLQAEQIQFYLTDYLTQFYGRQQFDFSEMYCFVYDIMFGYMTIRDMAESKRALIDMICLHPSKISLVLDPQRGKYRAKLTDFIPDFFSKSLTNEHLLYCSPEQIRYIKQGPKDNYQPDPENFLYSLAVLLCVMFSAKLPFTSNIITFGRNGTFERKPDISIPNMSERVVIDYVVNIFNKRTSVKDMQRSPLYRVARGRDTQESCNASEFTRGKIVDKKGDYVTVKTKHCRNGTSKQVMIKVFKIDGDEKNQSALVQKVENEYDIMRMCDRDEFLKVHYLFYTPKGSPIIGVEDDFKYGHIVMECNNQGNLKSFIEKYYYMKMVPDDFMYELTSQLLKALWYLHGTKAVMHRDISVESICIGQDKETRKFFFKLSDFGQARVIDGGDSVAATTIKNFPYAPPEGEDKDPLWKGYTYKVDLWLLATTLYLVRTHFMPFSKYDQKVIIHRMYNVEPLFHDQYWRSIPQIRDLLKNIFVFNDDERIGWPQIHRDKFWRQKMGIPHDAEIDYSTLSNVAYKIRRTEEK